MHYTVYKIVNEINGKIYIGKHQTEDLYDDYMGSGKLISASIRKYGIDNFKKEILFVFETEIEMEEKEIEIVNEEFVMREDTYNIALGGQGGKIFPHKYTLDLSKEEKIRRGLHSIAIHTGSKRSEKTKEQMRKSQLGKTKSESTKSKISETVKKSIPMYVCDVCNKEGRGGGMKRFHFENCKYRSQ